MSSSRTIAGGGMALLCWLAVTPALGQRIQFPTTVRGQMVQNTTPAPAYSPPPTYSAPPATYSPTTPAPTYATPGTTPAPAGTTYAPAPTIPSYTTPSYTTPSATIPSYTTPSITTPSYTAPSYTAPPAFSSPAATFQGNVTPAPAWDPYVDPNAMSGGMPYYQPQQGFAPSPPALFPSNSGTPTVFSPNGYAYTRPDGSVGSWPRLFQEIRGEYTWLAKLNNDPNNLQINSIAASGTLAFPFFYDQSPLLVTPGGAIHFLDGPVSQGGPNSADMPPQLYDLYLDTAWKPVITPWLSADLGMRVGLYTDFEHVGSDSIRLMGRGLGVLTFSPTMRIALGAVYLDRVDIKLLPAGGLIWTPNEDTRFDILFPNPKLAKRLTTLGTTEWWWYVAGEYGMGSWSIQRTSGANAGGSDQVDINDIRVIGGLEWFALSGMRGIFEVAYVFDRQLVYASGSPRTFDLEDTMMLRAGLAF